ncbi:peptidylprolyl isomerase [Paenibacillus hamazuiensis]|uniref:peptidylprolyl isomerase n=1 Tax=Paenibacillus hamazuiensis TaxID=2936508 RepID=UPI00200EA7FB|nr:peptidylprolyl isomerase [Paenibacillus hamazuiensis]
MMNRIKNGNFIWILLSVLLLAGFATYVALVPPSTAKKAAAAESVVAKVNGTEITSKQLYDAMVTSGGAQTLDSLITDELIAQEGKKAGIQVTDADIEKELATLKSNFPSDEEFLQTLASYNMTLDDLKKSMGSQVIMKKILEPQVTITDDDIKKYYNDNLESLKTPEQVKASHIVVATKEEAQTILADLKKGADFAAAAKEKSTDAATKDKGGDMGYVSKGAGDQAFEKAAFALKAGDLSDIVQTEGGFEIIKVTDHKDAATPTLEEKKQEIHDKLVDQKVSELSASWLADKKAAATIVNNLSKSA